MKNTEKLTLINGAYKQEVAKDINELFCSIPF